MSENLDNLFDEEFMRRLERLFLAVRKASTDAQHGQRMGASKGGLIEFKDYRNYSSGDDLRYVDWNLFSRLGKLFVKEFAKDENISVMIILDTSASMAFGNPSKRRCALRLTVALAYLALAAGDTVTVNIASEDGTRQLNPLAGKSAIFTLVDFLKQIDFAGKTVLAEALRQARGRTHGSSLYFVLSDFYDDSFLREIKMLRVRGKDVSLLHILSPEEIDPKTQGDFRLTDIETGEKQACSLTPEALVAYQNELNKFCDALQNDCAAHGVTRINVNTADQIEEVVLGSFRKSGLIR